MNDDAHYLRRVAEIRQKAFGSSGFLSAERSAYSQCLIKSARNENRNDEPPSKRSRASSEGTGSLAPALSTLPIDSRSFQSKDSGIDRSDSPPAARRIGLMEKWFCGNVLKVATIEHSSAPSQDYVESTMARITEFREKMLLLRNGAEDIESTLKAYGVAGSTVEGIPEKVLSQIRSLINQFAFQKSNSLSCAKMQLAEFLRVKQTLSVPTGTSAVEWHEFLNQRGPETPFFPITSFFVFPSSASLTVLFIVLTQRLQKRYRRCKEEEKNQENEKSVFPPTLDECTENGDGSSAVSISNLNPDLSESERNLLIFLRLFMPVAALGEDNVSPCFSGYFTWLLACLTVLDTPLDPDTDRLASSLFHLCCSQVRAIGELKNVTGEQRGVLADVLLKERERNFSRRKRYNFVEDVGHEELLALHTIIILLSKIFRQNQNKLICLG